MEVKQLKKKTLKELERMVQDLEKQYSDECLDMRMGKFKDMKKPRKTRKDIARVRTIILEKQKASLRPSSAEVSRVKVDRGNKLIKKPKDGKDKT